MEAQKCKICGEKHWGSCEKFVETITAPGSQVVLKRFLVPISTEELLADLEEKVNMNESVREAKRATLGFDRVAYQREYMRTWRKRQKEKGTP